MVGAGGGAYRGALSVEEEIRAALEEMKAERTGRFLRHLVEAALRGENEKLNDRALGVEFFGRAADWDPEIDAVVRNEAGRLRKRLARYYETDGAAAGVRIQLPPGSFVPVFVRRGEAGFQIEPSELDESAPELSMRWYVAAAVLIAAIAIVGWLYWHAFRTTTVR
jgi:hypothetical protein